jgi:glutamate-1-semialdehyde 2,1-aminomutase
MPRDWTYSEADMTVARRLCLTLPGRLFDFHAHLYRTYDLGDGPPSLTTQGPAVVTKDVWRHELSSLLGEPRVSDGLFMPYPYKGGDIDAGNAFLLSQLDNSPSCGLLVVTPRMTPSDVGPLLRHPRIRGFKPYHIFAERAQTFDACIEEYVPEWAWQVAHERRLIITLHLVRHGALSDPQNQRTITTLCAKYPHAQLVLAHAARGFHAPNTIDALPALRGLENVWFDTSAICEPEALMAIIQEFGAPRLLWGSDFPVSHLRGKCVTVGDAFSWICPERIDVDPAAPECRPILVGLESLRALLLATRLMGLAREEIEDIFCGNAQRLLTD